MSNEVMFLIGRVLFGGYFVISGFSHFAKFGMMKGYAVSKGTPAAGLAVAVTGLMLVFGGFGVLLGIYIQLAVWLLVVFLLAAAFKFHDHWNIADPQMKMTQMLFFMRNVALIGAALMLLAIPAPWPFSF